MTTTGFNVPGHGDLSIIFKAKYPTTGSTAFVNYTAKNGKDLSLVFEPATTNDSKISYATNYKNPQSLDLQEVFMNIRYVDVVVTGETTIATVSTGGVNYTYCVFESSGTVQTVQVNEPPPGGLTINYVLVGGGGGGGNGNKNSGEKNYGGAGGGGGAGGLSVGLTSVTTTTTFNVSVSGQAPRQNSAYPSTFESSTFTATAGGGACGDDSVNDSYQASGGTSGTGNIGVYTGNGGLGGYGQLYAVPGTIYSGQAGFNMASYGPNTIGPVTIYSDGNSTAYISIDGVTPYNICGGGGGGSGGGVNSRPGAGGIATGGSGGTVGYAGNGDDGGNYGGGGGGGAAWNTGIFGVAPTQTQYGGAGGPGLVILWWITPS